MPYENQYGETPTHWLRSPSYTLCGRKTGVVLLAKDVEPTCLYCLRTIALLRARGVLPMAATPTVSGS